MKPVLLTLFLALPAQAVAQGFTEDDVERYIAAIVANGCTMTEDEAEELLPAAGFSQEMSIAISELLIVDGRALADEELYRLTLSDEACG